MVGGKKAPACGAAKTCSSYGRIEKDEGASCGDQRQAPKAKSSQHKTKRRHSASSSSRCASSSDTSEAEAPYVPVKRERRCYEDAKEHKDDDAAFAWDLQRAIAASLAAEKKESTL
jgi:hypothetical protein